MQQDSAPNSDGTRSYPIAEAFRRLGIKPTKGYEIIENGELETYLVGRFRYATEDALQKFIRARIAASSGEQSEERANRVRPAVEGRAKRRAMPATV